jgi:cell division protein FtsL
MLKLLSCILAAFLIAGVLLHLRHQRMEINYKINQAHRQLQDLQVKLWNQQLQVAIYTAPKAIQQTAGAHDLKLVPATNAPAANTGTSSTPATKLATTDDSAAE